MPAAGGGLLAILTSAAVAADRTASTAGEPSSPLARWSSAVGVRSTPRPCSVAIAGPGRWQLRCRLQVRAAAHQAAPAPSSSTQRPLGRRPRASRDAVEHDLDVDLSRAVRAPRPCGVAGEPGRRDIGVVRTATNRWRPQPRARRPVDGVVGVSTRGSLIASTRRRDAGGLGTTSARNACLGGRRFHRGGQQQVAASPTFSTPASPPDGRSRETHDQSLPISTSTRSMCGGRPQERGGHVWGSYESCVRSVLLRG